MDSYPPPEQPHLDDEAISAALDGEATAADRLHLAGCERCSARQGALGAARAALAAPVEPLDEATRRLLLGRALEGAAVVTPAAARRRWFERPAFAGAAAAAVLVAVVAVGALMGGNNGNDGDESQSAAPAASAPESLAADSANRASSLFVGELGDVSTSDPLRFLADRDGFEEALPYSGPNSKSVEDTGGESTGSGAAQEAPAPTARPVAPAAGSPAPAPPFEGVTEADAQRCADTLATDKASGSTLRALASGTLDGRPVVVVAFERDGRTTAYLTEVGTCEVVRTYEL